MQSLDRSRRYQHSVMRMSAMRTYERMPAMSASAIARSRASATLRHIGTVGGLALPTEPPA